MNNPKVPSGFKLTGNPALDAILLKLIMTALGGFATWMATKLDIKDPEFVTALVETLLPIVAGAMLLVYAWFKAKIDQAMAVQAGVNLTVSGEAVTTDGEKIVSLGSPSAIPPKPVTPAAAAEIVKNFAEPLPK